MYFSTLWMYNPPSYLLAGFSKYVDYGEWYGLYDAQCISFFRPDVVYRGGFCVCPYYYANLILVLCLLPSFSI